MRVKVSILNAVDYSSYRTCCRSGGSPVTVGGAPTVDHRKVSFLDLFSFSKYTSKVSYEYTGSDSRAGHSTAQPPQRARARPQRCQRDQLSSWRAAAAYSALPLCVGEAKGAQAPRDFSTAIRAPTAREWRCARDSAWYHLRAPARGRACSSCRLCVSSASEAQQSLRGETCTAPFDAFGGASRRHQGALTAAPSRAARACPSVPR